MSEIFMRFNLMILRILNKILRFQDRFYLKKMILDADEILSIILIEAGKIIAETSINFQDFFIIFIWF